MPKLWESSIASHREAVMTAILDAVEAVVRQEGLSAVTMVRIAETAGIGRATLYKYVPDVPSALEAWHARVLEQHLAQLVALAPRDGEPLGRLRAVLAGYGRMQAHGHLGELAAALHAGPAAREARAHFVGFLTGLVQAAADAGAVRSDVPPEELAGYCLQALAVGGGPRSAAATTRLVSVVMDGLSPAG